MALVCCACISCTQWWCCQYCPGWKPSTPIQWCWLCSWLDQSTQLWIIILTHYFLCVNLIPVGFSWELNLCSAISNVVRSHTLIHPNIPVCHILNDEGEVSGVPGQCAHPVQQQVIVIPHNIGTGVALNMATDVGWPVTLTLLAYDSFKGLNIRRI